MIEIPQFVSHLKTYGGYPVPFTQMWIDGKPDFRAVDPAKTIQCVSASLVFLNLDLNGWYYYPVKLTQLWKR